ncbi:MAG TPA: hypothetical protein VK324_18290 [Tepidisphaeraceae bacterium]|nr:hypothetical protein [Tepidisphaeraceae bacterium]
MSAFSAGSIVGKLVLDTSGFRAPMTGVMSQVGGFGGTIAAFMVNPLLGAMSAVGQLGSAFMIRPGHAGRPAEDGHRPGGQPRADRGDDGRDPRQQPRPPRGWSAT